MPQVPPDHEPSVHLGRGIALVLATAVLWATSGIYIKSLALPWVTIAFYRALVAGVALLPLAAVQLGRRGWGRPAAERPGPWFAWVGALALCYSVVVSLFVWSTKLTTAANAIVLEHTAPLFAFMGSALLLGTPIRRRQWQSLAIAMAGIAILLGGAVGDRSACGPDGQRYQHLAGCALGLCEGVLFGLVQVLFRRVRGIPTAVSTSLNNLVCAALLAPLLLLGTAAPGAGPFSLAAIDPDQALWLATMGLVNTAIPYMFFTAAMRHLEATTASLLLLVAPLLNPLMVLWVGEVPIVWTIGGGALIMAALVHLAMRSRGSGA